MIAAVQRDTAEEVIRAGRALLDLCYDIPAEHWPAGFVHAGIDLKVLLNELEQQATNGTDE